MERGAFHRPVLLRARLPLTHSIFGRAESTVISNGQTQTENLSLAVARHASDAFDKADLTIFSIAEWIEEGLRRRGQQRDAQ